MAYEDDLRRELGEDNLPSTASVLGWCLVPALKLAHRAHVVTSRRETLCGEAAVVRVAAPSRFSECAACRSRLNVLGLGDSLADRRYDGA